ncbi:uncharacterized protein [Battus philenor]|uniref:uncharacterized protein n=1 Tax=Battus philenor TaxID=42288 RepID=UPI0035CFD531
MATLNDYYDATSVCRACLIGTGEMKNMVEHGLLEDFYKFSGVKMDNVLRLSELLCASCEGVLLECRRFRSLCQRSDSVLRDNIGTTVRENGIPESDKTEENTATCVLFENKLVIMITAPDKQSNILLNCPYQCSETFLKKSELFNHMTRKHGVEKDYQIEMQYYCTVDECSYNMNLVKKKYFSGRKFLNQHYNKVHDNKNITCDTCKMSFPNDSAYVRHLKTCNFTYECHNCNRVYKTNEKLLVHLMRHHPSLHQQYKNERKAEKRKSKMRVDVKKTKVESEYICDSPKRSFATQTLKPEENIKNDVALPSWPEKCDGYEAKTDEISTQTVFEDLLSLKSQASEDESIYFSETVSLSDIQTQTFPDEFGLHRSNKLTITSETQSPDLSIKETQTCLCLYDSPKFNCKLFDSVSSSPVMNLTSTETQTADLGAIDAFLGFNTAETQTSFEDNLDKDL